MTTSAGKAGKFTAVSIVLLLAASAFPLSFLLLGPGINVAHAGSSPAIYGPTTSPETTSVTVPSGGSTYIYVAVTGGEHEITGTSFTQDFSGGIAEIGAGPTVAIGHTTSNTGSYTSNGVTAPYITGIGLSLSYSSVSTDTFDSTESDTSLSYGGTFTVGQQSFILIAVGSDDTLTTGSSLTLTSDGTPVSITSDTGGQQYLLGYGTLSAGTYSFTATFASSGGCPCTFEKGVVVYEFPTSTVGPVLASYYFTNAEGVVVTPPFTPPFSPPLMGESYNLVLQINNPDTVSHTYSISVTQDCGTGCVETGAPNWPSWESFLGLPNQWNVNPSCTGDEPAPVGTLCGDSAQLVTVPPGGTIPVTFTFTNSWDWIAPYTWESLLGQVIQTTLCADCAWTLSLVISTIGASYFVLNEPFHFDVLSSGTPLAGFDTQMTVPDSKQTDYAISFASGFPAGALTVACLTTLVGCIFTLPPQAALIALGATSYIAAEDPSPDYTSMVSATPFTMNNGTEFVNLPAVKSSPLQWRNLDEALASVVSLENASAISEERYYGAMAGGSDYYANLQLQAVIKYDSSRDQEMSTFLGQFSSITSQIPPFTSSGIQTADDYLRENGLPKAESEILSGLGLGSQISGIVAGELAFNATSLNQVTMLDSIGSLNETFAAQNLVSLATKVCDFTTSTCATTGTLEGNLGDTFFDTATLSWTGPTPTGTITYSLYSGSSCNTLISGPTTQSLWPGGVVPNSGSYAPLSPGYYSYKAVYTSTDGYPTTTSSCASVDLESFIVTSAYPIGVLGVLTPLVALVAFALLSKRKHDWSHQGLEGRLQYID